MSQIEINRWKDSASMSWSANEKEARKNGYFTFEVTAEQKEHLEKNHVKEVDEWCKNNFGEETVAIKFEPFFNGTEDVYTCECYFEKWYNQK